jgi:parvulin-like peptidyl-prolyl isomerase
VTSRAALPLLGVVGLLLAGLPARAGDPPAAASTTSAVPSDSWAMVDSRAITRAEVTKRAKLMGFPEAFALEMLVNESIIADHLDKDGVSPGSVSADELAKGREAWREAMKRGGQDPDARMKADGITVADLDAVFRVTSAFKLRVERDATDVALHEAFEKRWKLELAGEVRARHILVTVKGGNDAAALQAALAVLSSVAADGSNMATLARAVSEDPNAPLDGGDLDWFSRFPGDPSQSVRFVPEAIARACFAQGKEGVLPEPVRAHDGYHVVFVTGIRFVTGTVAFDPYRERVKSAFVTDHATELLRRWHDEAKIELAPDAPRLPAGFPGR